MPAIYRTILPRLKRSIESHGAWGTLLRSVYAPFRLWSEYRNAKRFYASRVADPFDLEHGIETSQRIHKSDLRVESRNWTCGVGYWPAPVELIREAISALPIEAADFTFIDFGSGKGRVLVVASEFPFARIVGVEYAPELHNVARRNLQSYRGEQKCRDIKSICQDMTDFHFPEGPLILFFYNPASESIMRTMAAKIAALSKKCWIVYVTPCYDVFESFKKVRETNKYAIYTKTAPRP